MTRRPRYTIGNSGPTRRKRKRALRRWRQGKLVKGPWDWSHLREERGCQ